MSPLTSYLQCWKDEILSPIENSQLFSYWELWSPKRQGTQSSDLNQESWERLRQALHAMGAWEVLTVATFCLCLATQPMFHQPLYTFVPLFRWKGWLKMYHMAMSWNVINIDKPQDLARIIHYFQTNWDCNGCTSHAMYIACPSLLQLVAEIYPSWTSCSFFLIVKRAKSKSAGWETQISTKVTLKNGVIPNFFQTKPMCWKPMWFGISHRKPRISLSALDEAVPFYEQFGFTDMTCALAAPLPCEGSEVCYIHLDSHIKWTILIYFNWFYVILYVLKNHYMKQLKKVRWLRWHKINHTKR